jgi:hypothetical protein
MIYLALTGLSLALLYIIQLNVAIATTPINRLHATGGRYALCTMCIGVWQGIALVLKRV